MPHALSYYESAESEVEALRLRHELDLQRQLRNEVEERFVHTMGMTLAFNTHRDPTFGAHPTLTLTLYLVVAGLTFAIDSKLMGYLALADAQWPHVARLALKLLRLVSTVSVSLAVAIIDGQTESFLGSDTERSSFESLLRPIAVVSAALGLQIVISALFNPTHDAAESTHGRHHGSRRRRGGHSRR